MDNKFCLPYPITPIPHKMGRAFVDPPRGTRRYREGYGYSAGVASAALAAFSAALAAFFASFSACLAARSAAA